jgi:hypothetical protein
MTRSYIGVESADGIRGICCYWDGYISHNGRILKENYNDYMKVCELVNLGDMSSLNTKINPSGQHSFKNPESGVCVFYGRDRGATGCEYELHESVSEFAKRGILRDAEYMYLFSNNEWKLVNYDGSVVSF